MTEDEHIDYWELGFNLHSREPELILAKVWRHAVELSKRQEDQFDFVSGYGTACRQHDDYRREHHETTTTEGI